MNEVINVDKNKTQRAEMTQVYFVPVRRHKLSIFCTLIKIFSIDVNLYVQH